MTSVIVAVVMFFGPTVCVIFGAFAGWVCGLFFAKTFALFAAWSGFHVAPYQLGAILGFISGFVRQPTSKTSD